MPSILQYMIRRIVLIPVTLVIITMVMYGAVMLTPPEARVQLYLPKGNAKLRESTVEAYIKTNKLDQPYWVQYSHWAKTLVSGSWGYSPSLGEEVLPGLIARTPVTMELLFYSFLVFVPLSLFLGSLAGTRVGSWVDRLIRGASFIGTSLPLFIVAVFALALFYGKFGLFPPERLSMEYGRILISDEFRSFTGFVTIDSLLNGRFDMFKNAITHLVLPVSTLSIYFISSLTYLIRSFTSDEQNKMYVMAARSRGLTERGIRNGHIFRVTLSHSLTALGLAAATIMMNIFVIEIIFNIHGVSSFIVKAMRAGSDAPATLGFMIYSVLMVLALMLVIDLFVGLSDPRAREEVLSS